MVGNVTDENISGHVAKDTLHRMEHMMILCLLREYF
uniref:Putative LOC101236095 [Hydra vulgaris] n=1 Tax=Lepeophtheirus salmonis TaxID=72036 RepID=A0A0K2US82_LEPSM